MMRRASMLVAGSALLGLAMFASAAEHQIAFEQLAIAESETSVALVSRIPPTSVNRLSGISLRVCWSPTSQAMPAFEGVHVPPGAGTHQWTGSASSLGPCDESIDALGVPLTWLDEAAGWPDSVELVLVTLRFLRRADSRHSLRIWVEPIGMAAGHELASAPLLLKGTSIFRDGFD
jgi:hypothetical protein